MALTRSTDPLVWIDCEMTGLDPETDQILSIACYLTTYDLQPLIPHDQGYQAIISTPVHVLENMSAWCIETHGQTGLTQECLASSTSAETAARDLLAYIKRHIPEPRTALLAGNSVHVDKLFLLKEPWRKVVGHLHYRILDVSAIKEGVRRWCDEGSVLEEAPRKKLGHTAKEDVLESIEEARYYMQLFRRLGK